MTVASVLLALLGFMVLIVLHELGHFAAAKWVGMRVERFALFFPPLIWRKQVGETEYALGTIPAGGYVRISGMNPSEDLPDDVRDRAYHAQPPWKRMVVIAAGPLVNLVLALVLLFVFFVAIGPRDFDKASATVDTIEKGYPAEKQLKPGDRIVSIDGVKGPPGDLSEVIATHTATPAKVRIERDGRIRTITMTPKYDPKAKRVRLGFSYLDDGPREPFGAGKALDESLDRFWFITTETVKLPARLFDSQKRKEIGSVVGAYESTRRTILDDTADVVGILAVVSLSLAIVNLFPFLPLDGGHIFWAAVEKLRRRPVPFAVMERAGVVGFMLVIGLFALGLTNDIDRLSQGGFEVR